MNLPEERGLQSAGGHDVRPASVPASASAGATPRRAEARAPRWFGAVESIPRPRVPVQSCEGHYNRGAHGGRPEPGDLEFARLTGHLQALQEARAVEFEVGKQGERAEIWLEFRDRAGHAEVAAGLRTLLHIPPAVNRVRVVFGTEAVEPEVIALRTRSLMQMLTALGTGVRIPPEDLANGSALAVGGGPAPQWLTVHSGRKRPEAAFVSVPYDGTWFWIEREDLASKTTLSVLTLPFSYLDNSGRQSAPVLTIPTN